MADVGDDGESESEKVLRILLSKVERKGSFMFDVRLWSAR